MARQRGKIFSPVAYNKQHLLHLVAQSRAVQVLFSDLARDAARAGLATGFNDPSKPFYFADHPAAERQVDEFLATLAKKIKLNIEEGNKQEWLLANAKNDEMVRAMLSSTAIPKDRLAQFMSPNLDALAAFQSRKLGGMGLSERVWRLTQQTKGELELALDIGLGEGRSADRLSRDVRSYLKEPSRLFRRVRDKHGALRLSQSAQAYHPGRGVYRSSYKNALRLTATENNMAYRTADHERWQQIDFVIGIEIQLSNNHPVVDICDELAGEYPKDFKFVGWHPFCRCHAVAKLPDEAEFVRYQQAMIDGEDVSGWQFEDAVTEMPDCWGEWVADNAEHIAGSASLPYFIADNKRFISFLPDEQDELNAAVEKLQFNDNSRKAIDELTAPYDKAIKSNFNHQVRFGDYTSGSDEINDVARFGRILSRSGNSQNVDDWLDLISRIDESIEQMPRLARSVDLFRGSRTLGTFRIEGMSVAELNKHIGEIYTDRGFTSFSFSHNVARGFEGDYVIVLKAKRGQKGVSLANTSVFNSYERQEEFLLPTNSHFKILGAKEVDGVKHVFVETVEDYDRMSRMSMRGIEQIGRADITMKQQAEIVNEISSLHKIGVFPKGTPIEFVDNLESGTLMGWTEDGTLKISTLKYKVKGSGEFSVADELHNALRKLKAGQTLTAKEEYAIETLFHESVHARATHLFKIEKGSLDEVIAEACTQLYARDRYVKIMRHYGVEAVNFETIQTKGLGYRRECNLLRKFFTDENGKRQVGELINIANETESGVRILKKKLAARGLSEQQIEDFLSLLN